MFRFLISRLVQAVWVILAVSVIAFALFQYVGDPVSQMLGQDATASDRERLRVALGLDQPFYVQFATFIANAVSGDFGLSLKQGRPVSDLILERMPATLELAGVAAALAVLLGIPLGTVAALNPRAWPSRVIMSLSLIGVSLPTFFIGILLIFIFSVKLGWLPSYGRGQTVDLGAWRSNLFSMDGWAHLILPAITLCLFQLTLIVRLVRGEVMEVLGQDFIRFARARGLSPLSVYLRHALRNALIPVVTIIGLQLGTVIAFALITETVFQWPGMGLLFAQSVAFADIPVMAAYLCMIAVIFVAINLIVDLLYVVIDPRLRTARAGD